ncbi:cyclic nucleotide-gated ion channel 1-like isoform X3 [Malus domestica]|uniref:cyclic nucleotide-gated ion channel 1-like isoform X3 n=1 Tax=Malus domestica TaxID=3750 RepID=UPI0010AAFC40|nr:cyclic nucleotide-gated ion channel 1-like isoform X3 [Malus domestica]XP_028962058.1 cyclic nucleotide-gated ion channel 1-like isoform X3 [Malus domestica]
MANRDVENQAAGSVSGPWKVLLTLVLYAVRTQKHEPRKFLHIWSKIFVMSCVFAVSLDPLFLYTLIIDQDNKCLQMDKKLSTTVLVLRSFTDIIFVVPFLYKVHKSVKFQMHKNLGANVAANTTRTVASSTKQIEGNLYRKSKGRALTKVGKKIAQKMSWFSFSIINDFLSLLPVPQLLIIVTFYNMRGAEYVEHRKVLNVFILGQYLPRVYRVHQSSKKLQETAGIWIKGLFNFFLYMLASHILGGFWYFFSIQQETLCWYNACAKHSPDPIGCMNTFYCGRQTTTSRNITLLNEHCPLDTPDGVLPPFNFGIFLDSLKNRNLDHIKFEKKFFYSFWWGLRNLSNFGTNLITSTYVWENLFAILISVVGLLLFLYLIGNVQTFMQMEATKTEERRQKAEEDEETKQKISMKMLDVRRWISENKFPDDVKEEIMDSMAKILKQDKDADVHKPFLILPWQTKRSVKRHLFMGTLKKVNRLKGMNEKVLTLMCDCLKPVTYGETSFVFRMGDPLDCMMFIIQGTVWTYGSSDNQVGQGVSSMAIKRVGKGYIYGEELLDWASDCFNELPVSSKHVKSQTKVEAFVLLAKDLETVVSRCKTYWDLHNCNNPEEVAVSTVRRFFRRPQRRPPLSSAEIWNDINRRTL